MFVIWIFRLIFRLIYAIFHVPYIRTRILNNKGFLDVINGRIPPRALFWNRHLSNILCHQCKLFCQTYHPELLHGTQYLDNLPNIAAISGCLKCLKYSHNYGYQWYATTCTAAAIGRNLHCLKYLHENGCPWDKYTASYAKGECLIYAYQNQCPQSEHRYVEIRHILLERNLAIYLSRCLLVRKILKLHIGKFRDRYYSLEGQGFIKARDHFKNLVNSSK